MDSKTEKATLPIQTKRRLHPAVLRLLAMIALFGCWMGYLVYLVATLPETKSGTPLILSHSQILVSQVDVIAQVDDLNGEVVVDEVLYPKEDEALKGKKIRVLNLKECRPLPPPTHKDEKPQEMPLDWTGPTKYLLPLEKTKEAGVFIVTPTPPTPGYPPWNGPGAPRIYPATPAALAQYHSIKKPVPG